MCCNLWLMCKNDSHSNVPCSICCFQLFWKCEHKFEQLIIIYISFRFNKLCDHANVLWFTPMKSGFLRFEVVGE